MRPSPADNGGENAGGPSAGTRLARSRDQIAGLVPKERHRAVSKVSDDQIADAVGVRVENLGEQRLVAGMKPAFRALEGDHTALGAAVFFANSSAEDPFNQGFLDGVDFFRRQEDRFDRVP
jgi:hypothetical protein